jgi:HD-GYP domain-containing protein (c-di-GMP phosphodiesterase class II)
MQAYGTPRMKVPRLPRMPRTMTSVTGISATATVAAGTLLWREHRATARVARLGAAALETLLNAIDANDPVTGAHVRRVARYALVLARVADLDQRTCHSVERIALFHDIGKIHEALFDVIHEKTSLTAAERRAVNTHPRCGAEVLAPLAAFYPDLPDGVLSHHERWDGTGYPRRLRAAQIPITVRIVSIADTFDAMTHKRRYSHAKSFASAIGAIAAGRARQFDPDLVDLFMSVPVLKEIREEMVDANRRHSTKEREVAVRRRHPAGAQLTAPDVMFRWRDTAPPPPRASPPRRKSPR